MTVVDASDDVSPFAGPAPPPDAVALAAAIRDGTLTARAAIEAALTRLDEINPALNAVVLTLEDEALAVVSAGLMTNLVVSIGLNAGVWAAAGPARASAAAAATNPMRILRPPVYPVRPKSPDSRRAPARNVPPSGRDHSMGWKGVKKKLVSPRRSQSTQRKKNLIPK